MLWCVATSSSPLLDLSIYLFVYLSTCLVAILLGAALALNGGGQNTQRTALVCAMLGATLGASAIPMRWLDGLENGDQLLSLAYTVAEDALDTEHSPDVWSWQTTWPKL